ncbi:MAG: hypothetical protein WCC53_03100 [Thermoanaerobaculia bacterium]|jgi:hypothetical protein
MKPSLRSAFLAATLAAASFLARAAIACPSCAATSSPKEPNVWPIVGIFMLVPWALGFGAVWLVRRESRTA